MKRALLILFAVALTSAVMLTAAFAEGSLGDPAGDAGTAPDITGVQVSNDSGGTILFRIAVANLTPESELMLMLDTDKSSATGELFGAEYVLGWSASATPDDNGWFIEKWDGKSYVHPDHPTMHGMTTTTGVEFSINKSDLGGASGFALKAGTARYVADAVTGTDLAPDGLGSWTYDLTRPPPPPPTPSVVKPVFGAVKTVPARPVAGKRLVFTLAVNRSDTGAPLTTGTMVCDPSVAGKVIRHAESFTNGKARLAFVVPRTASGKVLKVKVTIKSGSQSATKVVAFKVR